MAIPGLLWLVEILGYLGLGRTQLNWSLSSEGLELSLKTCWYSPHLYILQASGERGSWLLSANRRGLIAVTVSVVANII